MPTDNSPKDGGPAFPRVELIADQYARIPRHDPGMSLRDWFAGMAAASHTSFLERSELGLARDLASVVAKNAYILADAMLAARENK